MAEPRMSPVHRRVFDTLKTLFPEASDDDLHTATVCVIADIRIADRQEEELWGVETRDEADARRTTAANRAFEPSDYSDNRLKLKLIQGDKR